MQARARSAAAPAFVDITGRDRLRRLAFAATAITAMLAYANAAVNGFVLDDGGVILGNPLVTAPMHAWRAFGSPYWPETLGGGQYRPLGTLTFALDWALSGGDARWFHVVNMLWHAAASVAVFALAAELLAPAAAAITALLFAVHPVHVEAVSNVVGRLEPMAAVFVIGALLAHRRRRQFLAPAAFALGLLSKESAIVFVGFAAVNDMLLERDWRPALRARRGLYAAYGGVVLAYTVALVLVFHDRAFSTPARVFAGTTVLGRLVLAARVIPHYARLLTAPADLSATYAPNVISPDPHWSLDSAFGVVLLAAATITVVMAIRRRERVLAFAILWVPIALAPVSNVLFPSGIVLAERTLYLASVGACLAIGAAAETAMLARPRVTAAVLATMIAAFALRTWTRTPVWRDDRVFVLTTLADHPESYDAHLAAGRVLKAANELDQANRELTIARQLFRRDPRVYIEAADLAVRQNRPSLAAALLDSARRAETLPMGHR